MRKFAFFSLLLVTFFFSMSEAEEKKVECEKIKVFLGLKTCFMNGTTTIDSRGFIISSTEDHEMQQLYFANNEKIHFLPENIGDKYPNLVEIRAKGCSIKSIYNGVFHNLMMLKKMWLDYNQIEKIENNSFEDLKSLEELSLDANKIKIVDEKAFKGLTQLKELWLKGNQIEKIENYSFEDLKSLKVLRLENNKIKFMNGETFAPMKHLTCVDLEDNVCINKSIGYWFSTTTISTKEFSELVEIISNNCGFNEVTQSTIPTTTTRPVSYLPTITPNQAPRSTSLVHPTRPVISSSKIEQNLTIFEVDCGKVSLGAGLVIGGSATKHGQWPFLVSLYDVDKDNHFCGGSLITNQHVLTAAHCLQYKYIPQKLSNRKIIVLLGKFNLALKFERDSKFRNVQESYIHHDWVVNDYKWDADLAILLLEEPVKFSNVIQPVCLPKSWEIFKAIDEGTVVGWGKSESTHYYKHTEDIPRQVTMKVISDSLCYTTDPEIARLSSVRTFCAGGDGAGPCNGDSGGGLYSKIGDSWNLRGMVSSSLINPDGSCNTDTFAVFTKIPDYFDWIRDTVANTSRTP